MNYYNHFEMEIEGTYIISLKGNEVSERLTQQCYESCQKIGQPNVNIFPAFDATDSPVKVQKHDYGKPIGELGTIKVPEFLKINSITNSSWETFISLTNPEYEHTEDGIGFFRHKDTA